MKINNKDLHIRINDKLFNRLKENARDLGLSDSVFIRKAIINFCNYFEKMPRDKMSRYDEFTPDDIKEMIEIAQYPWTNIDLDDK